ncbi:class II aldolase/adducin N-terminal [Xylariomycetidae sp. FL2044]|nr:class II aldolase/adducin N-terminal [Xylariomycetidae sp. FL2044]
MSATTVIETQAPSATLSTVLPAKGPSTKLLNFDENGKPVYKVPEFSDKLTERRWALEQVAGAFRVFARLGYADGGAGHISLRDPVNPHHFWINPYAKHFACMTVSDLVLITKDGEAVVPTDKIINTAGFMIHSALHLARPDVHVAIHLHSPYGRAWSIFGKPIEILTQDMCYFQDDLSVYTSYGGAAIARDEGEAIARALGPRNKNIILQNHGILTCGGSVGEAAAYYIALERACHAQLLAEAAAANNGGMQKKYIDPEQARYNKEMSTPGFMYMQFVPEYELALKESKGDFLL